jgi:hypothetical protein
MRNHNAFKIIAAIFLVALVVLLLNSVLRSIPIFASPGPGLENITILCFSCSFPGLPQEGHLILMDTKTGDIWAYRKAAMIGKVQPVFIGTLSALGKHVVKKNYMLPVSGNL